MAGRFSNIQYNDTVNSVLGAMKNVLNNPYYMYSDKSPTPVTYYHLDKEKSVLDEGSELAYNDTGDNSPFYYHKIKNMMIYGVDTPISISMTNDDYGLQSEAITGAGIVLPDTIIPNPNDFFIIDYTDHELIFKINNVTPDTLENGKNIYQFEYRSSTTTQATLDKQVSGEYELIITNIGTQLNPILKSDSVILLKELDDICTRLKLYFANIFYSSRVQTFVFNYLNDYFYDPYVIEFILHNNIMDNMGDDYIYITHQTPMSKMFPFDYKKTFFYCLEQNDIANLYKYKTKAIGKLITSPVTIFSSRLENYYELEYNIPKGVQYNLELPCFRDEFFPHIKNNKLFVERFMYYNLIIKYMNGENISLADLKFLDDMDYEDNIYLYHALPCIIFCIEKIIESMMSKSDV